MWVSSLLWKVGSCHYSGWSGSLYYSCGGVFTLQRVVGGHNNTVGVGDYSPLTLQLAVDSHDFSRQGLLPN